MPASSRALALVNLLKTMIGAGLLTLPFATSQVGLILSFFGLADATSAGADVVRAGADALASGTPRASGTPG